MSEFVKVLDDSDTKDTPVMLTGQDLIEFNESISLFVEVMDLCLRHCDTTTCKMPDGYGILDMPRTALNRVKLLAPGLYNIQRTSSLLIKGGTSSKVLLKGATFICAECDCVRVVMYARDASGNMTAALRKSIVYTDSSTEPITRCAAVAYNKALDIIIDALVEEYERFNKTDVQQVADVV